jgi:hypothetical protein
MTVSTITVDRRKLLLAAVVGLAATATAGIAIAAPVAADPIFAAIEAHREASCAYDAASKAAWARYNLGYVSECDALVAAIDRVIDTAPTTRAGLKALSDYLADAENWGIGVRINQRLRAEGHVFKINPDPDLTMADRFFGSSVAFFIARRTAEIDRG